MYIELRLQIGKLSEQEKQDLARDLGMIRLNESDNYGLSGKFYWGITKFREIEDIQKKMLPNMDIITSRRIRSCETKEPLEEQVEAALSI